MSDDFPGEAPQPKPPTECSEAGSLRALVDEPALLATIDGAVWAKEFCRLTKFADEGWALAWFCNAIMAGYDEARRRIDRDLAKAWSEPASSPVDSTLRKQIEQLANEWIASAERTRLNKGQRTRQQAGYEVLANCGYALRDVLDAALKGAQ